MRDLSAHRRSLGGLYVFVHLLVLLGAAGMGYATWLMANLAAAGRSAPSVQALDNPLVLGMAAFVVVLVMLGFAGISLGMGLLRGSPVSRGTATLLAILALPNFPLGTVLGVYSLWYFGQEGWDAEPQVV